MASTVMKPLSSLDVTLTVAFVAACGPVEVDTATSVRAARVINGTELNGRGLNGRGLNGRGLNGRGLNGRGLNGRGLNGRLLDGAELWADGGRLRMVEDKQRLDLVADLGGTLELDGVLEDGTQIGLRITAAEQLDSDLVAYEVDYFDAASPVPGWYPIALDADGRPAQVLALRGRWNHGQGVKDGGKFIDDHHSITFAVRGYALAKCVEWGYKPWVVGPKYHQTCTRLVRADYCGDGRSWTRDGTLINIFDDRGVQVEDTEPPMPGYEWRREAEWKNDGAKCVTKPRVSDLDQGPMDAKCVHEIELDEEYGTTDCATEFHGGAHLMSDYAHPIP
jgi:hypothetical protein